MKVRELVRRGDVLVERLAGRSGFGGFFRLLSVGGYGRRLWKWVVLKKE